ncbi:LOW QUALITY PROTEIN: hypothetical protein Cgig2_012329 [Carnegiea gigantea]|uniref:Uncharacterized protein n=1 Tax=Carnegiea gigantea TaxID=171969 RepID=A0A9Q1GNG3_9CARY|nr:LOW QUALITY PROTEIN: hypothetical protein Cgig2_012329 [Carnegiea gigantea]
MAEGLSYHFPMRISFPRNPRVQASFKYYDIKDSKMHIMVAEAIRQKPHGYKMYQLITVLKNLRRPLMQLNNIRFKDIYQQLIKQRKQANYMYSINNAQRHPVTGFADIANVVTDFYQDLLGVQKELRTPLSTSIIKTHSVKILIGAFQSFSVSTGLTVNYNNSEIIIRGCKPHTKLQIM